MLYGMKLGRKIIYRLGLVPNGNVMEGITKLKILYENDGKLQLTYIYRPLSLKNR